jgi:hypothetical protein
MRFHDLRHQQARIEADLKRRFGAVLEHGQFILGPEVTTLEATLAEFVGVRHCVAVASGTDALLVALLALGVGPGDEVITPSFNFVAAAEMIRLLGAQPVFADIQRTNYNLVSRRKHAQFCQPICSVSALTTRRFTRSRSAATCQLSKTRRKVLARRRLAVALDRWAQSQRHRSIQRNRWAATATLAPALPTTMASRSACVRFATTVNPDHTFTLESALTVGWTRCKQPCYSQNSLFSNRKSNCGNMLPHVTTLGLATS